MPPVSVTMQPVKLPAAAVPVEADAAAEAGALDEVAALAAGELLVLPTLDVLLPHAAINRVAAPAATVTANEVCLTVSSHGKVARRPHDEGAFQGQTARRLFRRRV
jgi:hypothetical protein